MFMTGSGGPLVQRPKESDAPVFLGRRIRESALSAEQRVLLKSVDPIPQYVLNIDVKSVR